MPHNDEVQAWLEKARSDLDSARILLNHKPPIPDTAAFHSQQAAEKYLKALLIDQNADFHRVHNLVYLLDLCIEIDKDLAELKDSAALLTPYAVLTRYPGGQQPTEKQANEAYEAAISIVKTVESVL